MPTYEAYGVAVASGRALPMLVEVADAPDAFALEVVPELGAPPSHAVVLVDSLAACGDGRRICSSHRSLYFRYADGTAFDVDLGARRIAAAWRAPLTLEDMTTYLIGPVLGGIARRLGATTLHASTVLIDGKAVALVGDSGAGKSTLAAALVVAGHPLVTEDVLALTLTSDEVTAARGYPMVKLWGPSVAALFGREEALERIVPSHPTWDKRAMSLSAADSTFVSCAAPLGSIFVLDRGSSPQGERFERLAPAAAVVLLAAHDYTEATLTPIERGRAMQAFARVCALTPVWRALVPDGLALVRSFAESLVVHERRQRAAGAV